MYSKNKLTHSFMFPGLDQIKDNNRKLSQVPEANSELLSERINNQMAKIMKKQKENIKIKALSAYKSNEIQKQHECQKCQCSGSYECGKKIAFLEGKIRQFTNIPSQKQVIQVYDIEKMGLNNQNYLVEYSDNTMQKVHVTYLKKHYLRSYLQFLEDKCFSSS